MRSQDRRRRNRRRAGVALVVAGAVVAGWLATAPLRRSGEQVYTPDRDAYVSTAHPDANYGTRPTLRAVNVTWLHTPPSPRAIGTLCVSSARRKLCLLPSWGIA